MVKENVQQTHVKAFQLRTNGKEEIEKLWKMKSVKKRDSKEQKLTIGICISRKRGYQQHKIWDLGRTEVTMAEELNQQHDESDDQLQNKVWDTG